MSHFMSLSKLEKNLSKLNENCRNNWNKINNQKSEREKQFVVMWFINGTTTTGIWTCIANTKSEAEAKFKKTLPKRKKYNDPKYIVSDVLVYALNEKTPENIDKITKEEILERSCRWRNKTNKSSNEPIKGSCRSMFTRPVVKGLFGYYIKK